MLDTEYKYQQKADGQSLSTVLGRVVFHAGVGDRFEVASNPDGETFTIKVFRLNPSGERISEKSKIRGYEFFRVEIQLPDYFALACFDNVGDEIGGRSLCKDPESLAKEAKRALEDLFCTEFLNS